jgi:hypothetical protein
MKNLFKKLSAALVALTLGSGIAAQATLINNLELNEITMNDIQNCGDHEGDEHHNHGDDHHGDEHHNHDDDHHGGEHH